MARLGMDVDEVESVGNGLNQQSSHLQELVSQIESLVNRAVGVWDGNDAHEFQNQWAGQYKGALTQAAHAIETLGQSALRNAQQQREVSQG